MEIDLRSNVKIPKDVSGKFEITHSMESKFDIVSMREAFLTGKRPMQAKLLEPIKITRLTEGGVVWMSDLPIEVRQAQEIVAIAKPRGRVLVGGLGLGIWASLVAKRKTVTEVVVVEKSADVLRLVGPYLPKKVTLVQDDFMEYVRKLVGWNFDCALVDVWRGTSEGEWWDTVFPLRRLIAQSFGRCSVHCWAEDIMRGQIMRSLTTKPVHWYYQVPWMPLSEKEARLFLSTVGEQLWEKKYGGFYPELPSRSDRKKT